MKPSKDVVKILELMKGLLEALKTLEAQKDRDPKYIKGFRAAMNSLAICIEEELKI